MSPTSVQKRASTDVAPSTDIDFFDDAEAGFSGAGAEAYAIPFLKVLQTNSPEVDETNGKYVKDAKAGMLLNTVTGELFSGTEGAIFVPCGYQRRFLRWAPRVGNSQGFRGELTEAEVAKLREEGKLVDQDGRTYYALPNGSVDDKKCDRVAETRSHFGLLIGKNGAPSQVLFALTSTQIKKSKNLMSKLLNKTVERDGVRKTAPMFSNLVRITTVREQNDRGSWFGVNMVLDGEVRDRGTYMMAKSFNESVEKGAVKVNYAEAADHEAESGGVDEGKF